MPFDYPGEYRVQFDGIDVGRFRELVVIPRGGQPVRATATLTNTGPGTIEVHHLNGVNAAGDLLIHRWQTSSLPAGTGSNVVIVALNASRAPVAKWILRQARPVKSAIKAPGTVPSSSGAIRTEGITIAHEGMQRVK